MHELAIVVVIRAEHSIRFEGFEEVAGGSLAKKILITWTGTFTYMCPLGNTLTIGPTVRVFWACQRDMREEN